DLRRVLEEADQLDVLRRLERSLADVVVLMQQIESRVAVLTDIADDRRVLRLEVRRPVDPQPVPHDLAAEVGEDVRKVLQAVRARPAGKRTGEVRGLKS